MFAGKKALRKDFSAAKLVARWQLIILVGLVFVRGMIYLSIFPPWVAPDEPAHFEVVRILGQENKIPTQDYYQSTLMNPELLSSLQTFRTWEYSEHPTPVTSFNPTTLKKFQFMYQIYPGGIIFAEKHAILPHKLLAPVLKLVSSLDIVTELYMLRFISVILAACVVVVAWLITHRLFPDQPQFWLAIPAFVIFLPTRTHIFAAVNSDVVAILLASVILLLLVELFSTGASPLKIILLIGLTFLTLFVKRTVIFVILWVGISIILYLGYRYKWPMKRVAVFGAITLGTIGILLGWIIINPEVVAKFSITLFNVDITAPGFNLMLPLTQRESWSEFANLYARSVLFAHITFWGVFGFNNINIPWVWAWGLMLLQIVIIFSALVYLYKAFRYQNGVTLVQRNLFALFSVGIILALGSAFFPALFHGARWGPQARYYFPAIIPIATFLFLGVWQLFPRQYRQTWLLPLWLSGCIIYDLLVVTKVLVPYFYG